MSRLTRDGTAEPVSRDQILRRERGQGNIYFPCLADHEQDWQPYPVDPYSCYIMYDYTFHEGVRSTVFLLKVGTVVQWTDFTCNDSTLHKFSFHRVRSGSTNSLELANFVQTQTSSQTHLEVRDAPAYSV